jgi:hypothetical protein
MSLLIPPGQAAILKKWLELPDGEIEKFLSALEQTEPQFNAEELARAVSSRSALPPQLISGILGVLITAYRTAQQGDSFEGVLDDDVKPALVRVKTFSPGKEEEEWDRLRRFLLHALSLESTIGTTAKAGPVLTEHERIFDSVRVLTDFRPIFHTDLSEKPNAGVIVHMLRITQRDKHKNKKDAYYALDSNDMEALRRVLDRALEKEKCLRDAMGGAGIKVLDIKAFY